MSDTPIELAGIRDRLTIAVLSGYWRDQRFEYEDSLLKYRGVNEKHGISEDATDWQVWKYTYSDGDVSRIEGPLEGAWSNRSSLGWD